jgi:hypothetical protein
MCRPKVVCFAPVKQRAVVSALVAATVAAFVLAAAAKPPAGPRDAGGPPVDSGISSVVPIPCGRDGGVDCPLQGWMKVNAGPPAKTGDIELLASAFDAIAGFAPHASAYPNWASIAKDGAAVARRGRVDAARVACVSCHEQYRARFRQQLRETPLDKLPDAGEIEAGKP